MSPPTRFVVLAAPRTGSNWLCTLLDSHPEVLCHHEIFNPEGIHYSLSYRDGRIDLGRVEERDRDPLTVLERVWQASIGHAALGFKLNRGQSPAVWRALFEDRDLRFLVIRRANRVKTYVSERLAAATGEWESYPGLEIGTRPVRVEVDLTDLRRHAEVNRRHYENIARALAVSGQESLDIVYEDLFSVAERRRILEFLSVEANVALEGKTRKQHASDLRKLIANFDELAERVRGLDLEEELHSQAL